MKARTRVALVTLLAALVQGAPAGAGGIPWGQVIGADAGTLDDTQKALCASILEKEKSYHGCEGTIAKCLAAKEGSMTARRLAGMVVRKVKAGYTADQIEEMVRKRGLSMHPAKTHAISLEGAPSVGDESPAVKVAAFSDFQCPYCRKVLPRLEKLAKKMKGVRLYFKHFPVKSHKRAVFAAAASLAAHGQGKFWPFHDLCYKDPDHLEDADLVAKAKEAGVADLGKFKKAMADKAVLKAIEKDKLEGLKLGVKGTPTIYIDGKEYLGETTYDDLQDVLSEELDLAAGKS